MKWGGFFIIILVLIISFTLYVFGDPVISNVVNQSITNNSAFITWTTDTGANSSVSFGTTLDLLDGINSSTPLTRSHNITLIGLNNNTLYYYNLTSCINSSNCSTIGPYNFTTLNNALLIVNVTYQILTANNFLELQEELDTLIQFDLGSNHLANLTGGAITNNRGTFQYTENLTIPVNASVQLDIDPNDVTSTPQIYLKFLNNSRMYTYKLRFPNGFESNISSADLPYIRDFENLTITIVGVTYTIKNLTLYNGSGVKITLSTLSNITTLEDTNYSNPNNGTQNLIIGNELIDDAYTVIYGSNTSSVINITGFDIYWIVSNVP
jgi:hypothetical protein